MEKNTETFDRTSWEPTRVSYEEIESNWIIADPYYQNLEELFLLRNPNFRFEGDHSDQFQSFISDHCDGSDLEEKGSWFYYPWSNTVIHFLDDALHQELRTGRNKYLISQAEQDKFYNSVIGVLGMSVGSHVALTIAMTGGARHIKLADPDILSGDNLNRIRSGFQHVGTPKVIAVARQIFEINPYSEIEIFPEGITEKNMESFLEGSQKLDLLVEEMDSPLMKLLVRFQARDKKIPIIMAADNGDSNIVDIERFDLDPTYPILHGLLGDMTPDELREIPKKDLPKIMARIAGAELAPKRMLDSVLEVGRSIYSWPQLGTAATMCGATLGHLARRVVLEDEKIRSGRYDFNQNSIFEQDYLSPESISQRKADFQDFLKKINDR